MIRYNNISKDIVLSKIFEFLIQMGKENYISVDGNNKLILI